MFPAVVEFGKVFLQVRYPSHFVSDIAIFVLKRDVKLQLTNYPSHCPTNSVEPVKETPDTDLNRCQSCRLDPGLILPSSTTRVPRKGCCSQTGNIFVPIWYRPTTYHHHRFTVVPSCSRSEIDLWSPYVIGTPYIFSSCFFLLLSSFFFPRLISAVGDWMFTILWHMVWP